ncbi:MAG: hypothetical protein HKN26_10495, partial [Acidimicrobiales bacterium]|nr:hypothetical protein [Acidimicrobiales bacterium]
MELTPIPERAMHRFLTLLGLAGIAVAQPLLSIFGDNPEYFVFVNARHAGTLAFALLVIAIPPVVLFGIEGAARLVGPEWPGWVHL